MPASKLRIYRDVARLLADARLDLVTDETETKFALDDAWDEAVIFCLRQAAWRFATVRTQLAAGGSAIGGYTRSYSYPADWLRTHKLCIVLSDGRECPIDVRETPFGISANVTLVIIEYISNNYANPDSAVWPESFSQAVTAYLTFLIAEKVTGEKGASGRFSSLFAELLDEAKRIDADPDDVWLPFQRSGDMLRGAINIGKLANWRFALQDVLPVGQGGIPASGFSYSFQMPGNHVHTQRIFLGQPNGRGAPIEVREQSGYWSVNYTGFTVRYVASDRIVNTTLWDEPFRVALLAYLQAGHPAMPNARQQQEQQVPAWFQAVQLAKSVGAEPDDPWLPYQFSGEMIHGALNLLNYANWRFAIIEMTLDTPIGSPANGFTLSYKIPSDHVHTQAIFISKPNGNMAPVEVREQLDRWSTNRVSVRVRYVSRTYGLDSRNWDEPFRAALLAYLQDDQRTAPQERGQGAPASQWQQLLHIARETSAEPDDPWLRHQLSAQFENGRDVVITSGYWQCYGDDGTPVGLKEIELFAETDQAVTPAFHGFPYSFLLPDDWMRTHALYVSWDGRECPINVRQTERHWVTDAPSFVARYLSTNILDAENWPELLSTAVLAWLDWQVAPPDQAQVYAQEYALAFRQAKERYGRDDNEWLRFQLNGQFQEAVRKEIETGRWRFAIRTTLLDSSDDPLPSQLSTGSPAYNYQYRFIMPNDLLRTIRLYTNYFLHSYGRQIDIDYFDEGEAYHANYAPVVVRYVSRLGLDSTKWTSSFHYAVLAWLEYQESARDPAKTQIAMVKLQLYKDMEREAERLDDARDMPRVIPPYIFRRGRFSRFTIIDPVSFIPTKIGPPAVTPGRIITDDEGTPLVSDQGKVLTDEEDIPLTDSSGNPLTDKQ